MSYYSKERIKRICEDIKKLAIINEVPIVHWQVKKGEFLTHAEANLNKAKWQNFSCDSSFWTGQDDHYWFNTTITVPKEFEKKAVWLNIATQLNFWDAVNPQFLLFVNEVPTQGFDINHRMCKLTDNAIAGEKLTIDLQAYTGRNSDQINADVSNLRLFSSICEQDESIKALYYNLFVPLKIISHLDEQSTEYIKLEKILSEAVNSLDLREPYSVEFYASVNSCNCFLNEELYMCTAPHSEVIASCVGHTHIDIAWWWTVAQTKQKVCRSFATVLKLMEEYPDYKFMSSQPQLYKYVKERYPEMYEQIKKRVAQGRWEVEGAMWLEADCNVTSGESLVRQFLHGKKFFKEDFDKDNVILWLPDVFGYSGALPQIMKKCGIKYFMTTKIAWNQFNKFPYDTFWWRGIDSSEIFTHLITTQDEEQPSDSFSTTYNGKLSPISIMKAWERYQQKDINNNILVSYGFGDGGGGPTSEMLECAKRMECDIHGAPRVKLSTAREYFDSIYSRLKNDKSLPRWVGELYLEYHRGTYTSMARNKKANRQCEFMWQDVELFCVIAWLLGQKYPSQKIFDSWETILLNQFHDILPGSSIKEVYDVTKIEYQRLLQDAQKLITSKLAFISKSITAKKGDILVFNTLSFTRDEIVELDYVDATAIQSDNGDKLPIHKNCDNKMFFLAKNLPPKGYASFTPLKEIIASTPVLLISDNTLTSAFYIITLDQKLRFVSIYDRHAERELLKKGKLGNILRVYEDKPIYYDNWDIDIFYKQKSWEVDDVIESKWLENNSVRATLFVKLRFLNSIIEQKIHFYSHTKRIDFETFVDWKQFNLLLKAEFPTTINATEATYDIQFGNIKRPTHKNTSWDVAKFEVCAHKWADLSECDFGVSLLNDCKYGYSVQDNVMEITLIKSGTVPNPTTDQEEHTFTYSFLSHIGDLKTANIHKDAYSLNVKPYHLICESDNITPIQSTSLLTIDCDNVVIETIKQADDKNGIIVRMYECYNCTTKTKLNIPPNAYRLFECDLLENNLCELAINDSAVKFTIKPFEIKTFKILF